MFKEVFKLESVMQLSTLALIIFVLVFIGITVWAWTRSRKKIDQWASIPLNDDKPVDPIDRPKK
jgi:cbb3-type cytochrome oxidase subunit 3